MKKKAISLLMAMTMTAALFTGCGGSSDVPAGGETDSSSGSAEAAAEGGEESAPAAAEEGDPYEITMQVVTWGQTPEELGQVEEAINAIILPEINATVSLQPVAAWDLINESQMALTSGEKMDVVNIFVCGSGMDNISNYTSKNMILPLNDLLAEYGPAIEPVLGDLLKIGYQGDQLYAIPSNTTMGGDYGFLIRKDYLDEVGITIDESRIYTPEEAEETLLALKEHYGDGYYGIALFGNGDMFYNFYEVDMLGGNGSTGVVLDPLSGNTTVVDLYETDEWMEYCKTIYRWAQEGLINPDVTTISDDITSQLQTGYYFAHTGANIPGSTIQMGSQVGTEFVKMTMIPAFSSTVTASQGLYAISRTSENPEKVMQFLNILYEERERTQSVAALLNAGLEGVSYEVVEEVGASRAIISVKEGSLWSVMVPAVYGDALTSPKYEPLAAGIYEEYEAFNKKISDGRVCKTFGYVFDPSEVSSEAAAVSAVVEQYRGLVGYGCVDPEEIMPEFIAALKDAGIDDVIAANQAQLDARFAGE